MCIDLKEYIDRNKDSFEVVTISTNKVQRFAFQGKKYILKTQMLEENHLSPFWQMMKDVFDSDFKTQRVQITNTCELLNANPHVKVVPLVMVNEDQKMTLFDEMDGLSWVPDEFPDDESICFQLGQFIGYNHHQRYESCGVPGNLTVTNVHERFLKQIEKRIVDAVGGPEEIQTLRELYKTALCDRETLGGYGLIMTDISANQFLFGEHHIAACVDLDACVIGPKEWELKVLENCVPNMNAFKKGYEQYQKYPSHDAVSALFGYIMR